MIVISKKDKKKKKSHKEHKHADDINFDNIKESSRNLIENLKDAATNIATNREVRRIYCNIRWKLYHLGK